MKHKRDPTRALKGKKTFPVTVSKQYYVAFSLKRGKRFLHLIIVEASR